MIADRRVYARPYFFELFTVANLLLVMLVMERGQSLPIVTLPKTVMNFGGTLLAYTALGVIIRLLVAHWRGTTQEYLARIRSAGWLTDLVRLLFFGSMLAHTYAWIKLVVPLLHPRLYDQELWNLDQAMLFGYSPNVLFINLFGRSIAMRAIDWSYARIFFASMTVAFGYFLSEPSRRLRVAFHTGNTVMWIGGAWLYMLLPSLGPAYRFPEIWLPLATALPLTQASQAMLMRNYQNLLRLSSGATDNIHLMFGIAAFPSLHVGFQTFAFLWMRRLWIYGEIVFGIFVLAILIGSVVTGWHYLIDGIAGILVALVSYWISVRMGRIRRWLRLRTIAGMTSR